MNAVLFLNGQPLPDQTPLYRAEGSTDLQKTGYNFQGACLKTQMNITLNSRSLSKIEFRHLKKFPCGRSSQTMQVGTTFVFLRHILEAPEIDNLLGDNPALCQTLGLDPEHLSDIAKNRRRFVLRFKTGKVRHYPMPDASTRSRNSLNSSTRQIRPSFYASPSEMRQLGEISFLGWSTTA